MALRVELVGTFFLAILMVVLASPLRAFLRIDLPAVSMILMNATNAAEALVWLVRHLADYEQCLIAVERTALYSLRQGHEGATPIPHESETALDLESILLKVEDFQLPGITSRPISWIIEKGERVALMGPNGIGKSSFISCLLRLEDRWTGKILLGGKDIRSLDLSLLRGTWITSILQNTPCYERQNTVREFLNFGLEDYQLNNALRSVFGSPPSLDGPPTHDGLDLQLLQVTRALLRARQRGSRLLVLDEATSLASSVQREIEIHQRLLDALPKDMAVLSVVHRPLVASKCYDRIIQL